MTVLNKSKNPPIADVTCGLCCTGSIDIVFDARSCQWNTRLRRRSENGRTCVFSRSSRNLFRMQLCTALNASENTDLPGPTRSAVSRYIMCGIMPYITNSPSQWYTKRVIMTMFVMMQPSVLICNAFIYFKYHFGSTWPECLYLAPREFRCW